MSYWPCAGQDDTHKGKLFQREGNLKENETSKERQPRLETTSKEDNQKGKTASLERQIQWEDRPQRETVYEGKTTTRKDYYVLQRIIMHSMC